MARRCAGFEVSFSENDLISLLEETVRSLRGARPGHNDFAAEPLAQEPRAGDVVGVHVRLERPLELEAELLDQRHVAARLLEHGIDQDRLARGRIGEEVGVSGRLLIEELPEEHARWYKIPGLSGSLAQR